MKIQGDMQYAAWKFQSQVKSFVYITSLIIVSVLGNFVYGWKYNEGIIFNNRDFNRHILTCIAMGLISLVMAYRPNILENMLPK